MAATQGSTLQRPRWAPLPLHAGRHPTSFVAPLPTRHPLPHALAAQTLHPFDVSQHFGLSPLLTVLLILFPVAYTVLRGLRVRGANVVDRLLQSNVREFEWAAVAVGQAPGWPGRASGPMRGTRDSDASEGPGARDRRRGRDAVHDSGGPPLALELDCSDGYGRVAIREGRSRLFKEGSPLVYAGNVAKVAGDPTAGDLVLVVDHRGNPIGWGPFNPHSMYRVRLLANARDADYRWPPDLGGLVEERLRQAVALRRTLGLPAADTSAYRLVHGEGDRLSGLVADVFNEVVAVQSSALWVERHRETVEAAVRRVLPAHALLWQPAESRLAQDGWTKTVDLEAKGMEGGPAVEEEEEEEEEKEELDADEEVGDLVGETDSVDGEAALPERSADAVQVQENGLRFWVVPGAQKTGFYCDQRSNRLMLRSLCACRSVLDLYSFTGGFALNAVAAGALAVTAVDSSLPALGLLAENAALNGMSVAVHNRTPTLADLAPGQGEVPQVVAYKTDVLKFLAAAREAGKAYDVLVVDPPKLCPHAGLLTVASRKYERINAEALRVVAPGGLVLTCTCSAAVGSQEGPFLDILRSAAAQAGRRITLLASSTAAADHPVSPDFVEGRYLRAVLLYVA